MARRGLCFSTIAIALLGTATGAVGNSLRCGQSLVVAGDSLTEMREACGQPERIVELQNQYGATVGRLYYYDPGYGKAERAVEVRNGRVVAVERQ